MDESWWNLKLRVLKSQDLLDLKDGAAIFSAGGGGSPEAGQRIVEKLISDGYDVKLVSPSEVPGRVKVVNFACVGATAAIDYNSNAAVKTLKVLEESIGISVFAVIPVELGGFNTLTAIDVAARCGIPVVDGDGAGRSIPEVHLKVYTIDNISLTPMVVSDVQAKNVVLIKETVSFRAGERIARLLATAWNQSAYTARRILTGAQVKTSPIQLSLTRSMRLGELLRKAADPINACLQATQGFRLFDGIVNAVEQKTTAGFTFVDIQMRGTLEDSGNSLALRAKNEVLAAYKNRKLIGLAPDIITPVNSRTGKCITAEQIEENDELTVIGISAPPKWRTSRGLDLWEDVLRRAEIVDAYVPMEQLATA